MTTRITSSMLQARALLDLRRSQAKNLQYQEQIATGRRVNRPSDDPAGTLRIMPLRAEVRDMNQLLDNADMAREGLDAGAANLEDGSSIMHRLRELTVQANVPRSDSDRASLGEEVDQLLQQMLGIANARHSDRYLFAGTRSETTPFEITESGGRTQVRYRGDQNRVNIDVGPGVSTSVTQPGDRIFLAHSRAATLFSGTTGARPSGATDSGVGFAKLTATFAGLSIPTTISGIAAGNSSTTALGPLSYTVSGTSLSINGGPATTIAGGLQSFPVGGGGGTVSLNITGAISPPTGTLTSTANLSVDGGQTVTLVDNFTTGAEYQVRSTDGTVLNVATSGLNRTGVEQVTYSGTFDVFTVLVAVRDTLRNTEGLSGPELSSRLTFLLGEIDTAYDKLLDGLRDLGNRSEQMSLLSNRVEGLQLAARSQLSRVEDTDLAESILGLNQQETVYQASLRVSSRIVQTSLLDYLR